VHRLTRILGSLLIAAGVLTLAWVVVVWRWQDPFTAVYTHVQQTRLSHTYERRAATFRPHLTRGNLASIERQVAAEARAYRRRLHRGDPIGRLRIGRIGLKMIVVQGTDHDSLKKGPGHYPSSGLPGEGHLIYVAGHRTTYLAPFASIDSIRGGRNDLLDGFNYHFIQPLHLNNITVRVSHVFFLMRKTDVLAVGIDSERDQHEAQAGIVRSLSQHDRRDVANLLHAFDVVGQRFARRS